MSEQGHRITHRVNVIVPLDLWQRFEAVAAAHFRSRSDHIRFLIDQAIRQHEEQARV